MRSLIFTIALLAFAPATQACRQKYIEFYKYKSCNAPKGPLDSECWKIESDMFNYSEAHQRVWGGDITADNVCGTCEPSNNQVWCTCTIRSWRFREWELEPGISAWPKPPQGWQLVYPDNGANGWIDTGHKNIHCD